MVIRDGGVDLQERTIRHAFLVEQITPEHAEDVSSEAMLRGLSPFSWRQLT